MTRPQITSEVDEWADDGDESPCSNCGDPATCEIDERKFCEVCADDLYGFDKNNRLVRKD